MIDIETFEADCLIRYAKAATCLHAMNKSFKPLFYQGSSWGYLSIFEVPLVTDPESIISSYTQIHAENMMLLPNSKTDPTHWILVYELRDKGNNISNIQ